MKKFFKGLGIFIKIILVLCLIFLAAYTIFCIIIPSAQNGMSFIDIIKNIAVAIWNSIKTLIGIK